VADPEGFSAAPAPAAAQDEAPLVADLTGSSAAQQAQFPYATWAKTMREVLSWGSGESLAREADPMGSPTLRAAIAGHVRATRGMEVDPDCMVVGAGAQWLYNLLVQLLGRGLVFAVEDPGYPRLTSIYRANDVRLKHVPLDAEGIRVDALRASGAQVAHVMPSHQYPTGVVTSVARRYELLGWAAQDPGRYVVEDDYDCEFRLSGRPVPALKSVDATGSVVYLNTFAKSLGAAFRIGYMVLPPQLAARYRSELGFYSCTVSAADQLTLAALLQGGAYERHVNRLRARSRQTCAELVGALKAGALGGRVRVCAQESGLHLVLGLEGARATDAELARAARAQGVAVRPLSAFVRRELHAGDAGAGAWPLGPYDPSACWFVADYAGLDPAAVPAVVQALERAWG
jgi:GntR family transcriptional regulator/MocR family aminotransferase